MATQVEHIDDFEEDAHEELEVEVEQDNDDDQPDEEEQPGDDGADDHDVITFGDAETQVEDEGEGMRNLRNRLREVERENRTLKGKRVDEGLGPRPALEDFGYDEDAHGEALETWLDKRNAIKARERDDEDKARKLQQRFDDQRRAFDDGFARLTVPGKDGARSKAEDALTDAQRMMVIKAGRDKAPALMVLLGSDRSRLDALLEHADDPADFLIAATDMAREINVTKRRPATQPESRTTGSPGGGSSAVKSKMERLMADAQRTGDLTALARYEREQEKAK